jgi:hypothetical protein
MDNRGSPPRPPDNGTFETPTPKIAATRVLEFESPEIGSLGGSG